jgi:hypothetical protein
MGNRPALTCRCVVIKVADHLEIDLVLVARHQTVHDHDGAVVGRGSTCSSPLSGFRIAARVRRQIVVIIAYMRYDAIPGSSVDRDDDAFT